MLQKAAGTLLFLTFVLQLLLAMSMSIDLKLQTTQELGASPNVMSYLEGSNEVRMYPLHQALQFAPDPYRQECVSALLKHELVRNLASEIHKNWLNETSCARTISRLCWQMPCILSFIVADTHLPTGRGEFTRFDGQNALARCCRHWI